MSSTKFCKHGEKGIDEFWSNVALVGLVFSSIIGIIVNGVTLYIISKRIGLRRQSIFASIFCLAFFDFLVCAVMLPIQAHRFYLREWPFGKNCTMQYIQVILVGLVTFTIGKLPFERPYSSIYLAEDLHIHPVLVCRNPVQLCLVIVCPTKREGKQRPKFLVHIPL